MLPAQLIVVAVEAGECTPGEDVSQAVRDAVPRAVERIESLIDQRIATADAGLERVR